MPYAKSFLSPGGEAWTDRAKLFRCQTFSNMDGTQNLAHLASYAWTGEQWTNSTNIMGIHDGYTWQHICIYFHTCYINNLFLDVACTSSPNEAVQYPTKRNNLFDHCSQVSWNTAMVFAVATLAAALKSWDAQCIHHFTLSKHSHIMMLFPKTSGTGKKVRRGRRYADSHFHLFVQANM